MAAGNTYTPIATQTLSTSAASVTFSSISGAYTDLVLIINAASSAQKDIDIRFNSDTAGNYSNTWMAGNGSSTHSGRTTGICKIMQIQQLTKLF